MRLAALLALHGPTVESWNSADLILVILIVIVVGGAFWWATGVWDRWATRRRLDSMFTADRWTLQRRTLARITPPPSHAAPTLRRVPPRVAYDWAKEDS